MTDLSDERLAEFIAWLEDETVSPRTLVGDDYLSALRELQSLRAKLKGVTDGSCEILEGTRWLIETNDPVGVTLYFCRDGDWCSSPTHAFKFLSKKQAELKLATMHSPPSFRVAEHEWVRSLAAGEQP